MATYCWLAVFQLFRILLSGRGCPRAPHPRSATASNDTELPGEAVPGAVGAGRADAAAHGRGARLPKYPSQCADGCGGCRSEDAV